MQNRIKIIIFAACMAVFFWHPYFHSISRAQENSGSQESALAREEASEPSVRELPPEEAGQAPEPPEEKTSQKGQEETGQASEPPEEKTSQKGQEETGEASEPPEQKASSQGQEASKASGEEPEMQELQEAAGEKPQPSEQQAAGNEVGEPEKQQFHLPAQEVAGDTVEQGVRFFAAVTAAAGIDEKAPMPGQKNTYTYTGGTQSWTVPVTGWYDVYCYGAQGGGGNGAIFGGYHGVGYGNPGIGGELRASRAFLQKGVTLTLHVGGMGGNGSVGSAHYEAWGGFGGYNDGTEGVSRSEGNSRLAAQGGGGGSSYILAEGVKVISAGGGRGGDGVARVTNGDGAETRVWSNNGGGAAGLSDAGEAVAWARGELNSSSGGVNSGNGYITITVHKVGPVVKVTAPSDWTNQDITITAEVTSEGAGLVEDCYGWEQDEEGTDIWTKENTFTVSQNGTYTCRIRDAAGNVGSAEIAITNIDKRKPEAELVADITDWTTSDITLTVGGADAEETDTDGCSGIQEYGYLWGMEEETEAAAKPEWQSEKSYTAGENGTYYCRIRDRAGNVAEVRYFVEKIDRTPPKVSAHKEGKWYEGKMKIIYEAMDLQPDGTPGAGLAEQAYSFDGNVFSENSSQIIEREGDYGIWVKDRLGNTAYRQVTVRHDQKPEKESGSSGEKKVPLPLPKQEEFSQQEGEPEVDMKAVQLQTEERVDVSLPVLPERAAGGAEATEKPITEVRKAAKQQAEKPDEEEAVGRMEPKLFSGRKKLPPFVLYSAWLAVVLCGLLWLLVSLMLEHVTVYKKDNRGRYQLAGRAAILRKKDYKQINLTSFAECGKEGQYKIRFGRPFVWLHRKDKVLIRTIRGVELRRVAREIEITEKILAISEGL